jgi:catalase
MPAPDDRRSRPDESSKNDQLEPSREDADGQYLTTNTGVRVNHTDDSLTAGERGPTLLEDFHFREKMTHFDHERVPERVVHARGSAAHGVFELYEPLTDLTKAALFQDPSRKTPVFVRFSTVVGFRGSADTVRDVRGWATKFYTEDGNWDLVGNNMPVFFIQDAIKFPDLVHAIKPNPRSETPQASAAHDNFWDFVSLMPESAHMIMWVLSDRALPRSYAMMEGFGVHTFRLVNWEGKARFVKFHWRPVLGTHSLVWDEAQKIAGKDPDFNRSDLWERIENGDYPEFELGLQIIEEEDEHAFDFDLLDPTKIVPEHEVPVRIVGKMTLNRNPDNFFAETEQVAFHPGHVVSGIDVTNDPLLQGRLFSYIDTQINRFSSANFNELPINRPLAEVHNNQRDGFMRQTINRGPVNYSPNSRAGGCPMTAAESAGGYVHYAERVDGRKVRQRSESFKDFFSQATMFWNSLAQDEQDRLVRAGQFELGKVESKPIRQRLIDDFFNHIDHDLAVRIASGIGIQPPASFAGTRTDKRAPEVSVKHRGRFDTVATRKVAVLLAEGFSYEQFQAVTEALKEGGAYPKAIAASKGTVSSADGQTVDVDMSYLTTASVVFDAVYVPGGLQSTEVQKRQGSALHFIAEAFKHGKAVGATGEAVALLHEAQLPGISLSEGELSVDHGVVTARDGMAGFAERFVEAVAQHRHFERQQTEQVAA